MAMKKKKKKLHMVWPIMSFSLCRSAYVRLTTYFPFISILDGQLGILDGPLGMFRIAFVIKMSTLPSWHMNSQACQFGRVISECHGAAE